ncbi:MAG TPA: hypothetical protein VGQ12_01930 [Candidatus Angelobacter sp.]|jgi:hypothetical protein|nr:hypothetical protein [Candidatus Angelobacter sp.]
MYVFAVLILSFYLQATSPVPEHANKPHSGHNNAKPSPSTTPIDQTAPTRPSPPKEENSSTKEANQATWCEKVLKPLVDNWPLVIISIWGICVAIRTVKAIEEQGVAMKGQLKEMQDAGKQAGQQLELTHRPWVTITPVIVTPLTFDSDGLNITVRFLLKNVGNSPAMKVVVHPTLDYHWDKSAILARLKALCWSLMDGSAPSLQSLVGFTLFPGDSTPDDFTFRMTHNEIAASVDTSAKKFIQLTIMGCVDYQFSFAEGHHQTPFIYDIKRYDASHANFFMMIDPSMGTLPVQGNNSVRLCQHIPGVGDAT